MENLFKKNQWIPSILSNFPFWLFWSWDSSLGMIFVITYTFIWWCHCWSFWISKFDALITRILIKIQIKLWRNSCKEIIWKKKKSIPTHTDSKPLKQDTWHNGYRRWFPKLLRRQSSGGCRFNPHYRRVTIQEYLILVPCYG